MSDPPSAQSSQHCPSSPHCQPSITAPSQLPQLLTATSCPHCHPPPSTVGGRLASGPDLARPSTTHRQDTAHSLATILPSYWLDWPYSHTGRTMLASTDWPDPSSLSILASSYWSDHTGRHTGMTILALLYWHDHTVLTIVA